MLKLFTILLLVFSMTGLLLEGSSLFEIMVVGLLFIIYVSLNQNTKK